MPVNLTELLQQENPPRPTKSMRTNHISFDGIRKSDVDQCEYRLITLPNQLQVLLIHEATLDKASAAVDVHVGSFSDPFPGVAHYLEHLLFMGTEKYPKENDYMEFLAAHGGQSNAFTDDEHTNYFFEVSAEHFESALDRFAQFFVAPLFNPDGTVRELQAVDSEHKKNVKDDMWRIHQMERTLSRPDHPYSHFGTGCASSLDKPDIRHIVVEFYKTHYSANIMKAVLYGRESLDQLAEWAEQKFSQVPNHSFSVPCWPARPWNQVQKLIQVKTVKEMQTLYIGWQLEDTRKYNESKPDVYLSHLIGHEGKGSLLSFLKRRHLVLGLAAGFDESFHGFSFFQISFELTPKGLKSVDEIIEATFQYIGLLKTVGPQHWIHAECAAINSVAFRFKDKAQSSSSYAYKLAGQMQEYPPERILSGPLLIEKWEPEAIKEMADALIVDNFRALLTWSGFKPDDSWEREQWYGTMYKVEGFDGEKIERFRNLGVGSGELHLPAPNEFIPKSLQFIGTLADLPKQHPDLISDHLWFKQDDQFGLPKSAYYVLFRTPIVFESPLASASAGLYVECAKIALSELTYDATLAGLSFELTSVADGFEVRVAGFSEKAPILLERIAQQLVNLGVDQETFASVKDRFVRHLKSLKEEKPIWHAGYYAGVVLQEKMTHWKDKLAAIQGASMEQVVQFGQNAIKSSTIVILVNGNESAESAQQVKRRLEDTVAPKSEYPRHTTVKSVRLPAGECVYYERDPVSNPNSAIDYYLQVGDLSDAKTRQSLQLFVQIFAEAFFDQLRTKEQLGYMVVQQIREKGISIGLRMAVQSERDPLYLESRIEAFLNGVVDRLESMEDVEFGKYKDSLISDLTAKKKKLTQETKAFWEEISGCRNDFERHLVDARGVAGLLRQDIIDFSRRYIIDAPERHKLVVHVWSDSKPIPESAYDARKVIKDISGFVESCQLFDVSYQIPR